MDFILPQGPSNRRLNLISRLKTPDQVWIKSTAPDQVSAGNSAPARWSAPAWPIEQATQSTEPVPNDGSIKTRSQSVLTRPRTGPARRIGPVARGPLGQTSISLAIKGKDIRMRKGSENSHAHLAARIRVLLFCIIADLYFLGLFSNQISLFVKLSFTD